MASPCPTSQFATCQSPPGKRRNHEITISSTTAAITILRLKINPSAITPAITKKLLLPVANVISGRSEIIEAIHATHAANGFTIQIRSSDNHGAIGEISPATKPKIVTGATAGAARTLARILMSEICPEIATMTGVQNKVAESGIAITMAIGRGIFLEKLSTSLGASNKSPAVARTERAKPGSRTCQGSATITAPIAKPSAGSESRPR